ncbi:hypothetical protein niasHT_025510 [Heterodera trifolii]|uniref:Uncharacterized protein n=1 Tax=Heterodera trifolii TaxID=157864 RepID=A0ABD2J8N8_9BILA
MLRHCCCCCAIVVVFSLFLAFLKFNSIDAGCGGSKEAVNKRGGWYNYCLQWRGKNVCDGKKLQPCILNNGQCIAATINAAPNLEHSAEWDTLCQNNLQRCALTTIKPCRWHQYTDESWQCVAKLTGRFDPVNRDDATDQMNG